MKRVPLSHSLSAAVLVAGVAVVLSVHAANTGSVVITATVPSQCNITVTPASGANIADLTTGNTNLKVATVNESCNAPDGYYVNITGTNSGTYTGQFRSSGGSTQPFSVSYNGSNVNATRITDATAPANVNKDVNITYAANAGLTAATYTETLNFVITAK
ncbi:MAG: hypothetical protein DI585_01085 [Pseudomonas fluorescens]|nr:MAG: hypothetical protein DI585_01085 [Pseudomonas fluorescens]